MRKPNFQKVVLRLYKLLADIVDDKGLDNLEEDDFCHSLEGPDSGFWSITIIQEPTGWYISDGDPICNWCFQTFTKKFPFSTPVKDIANFMRYKLVRQRAEWKRFDKSKVGF